MLKFCALILLLPFASMANDPCTQASCEKVYKVREGHPKLQGMEIQLDNGSSMSLSEYLENISEQESDNDAVIFGGEVPWPVTGDDCKKNPKLKGC